jgi:hypothetical protein
MSKFSRLSPESRYRVLVDIAFVEQQLATRDLLNALIVDKKNWSGHRSAQMEEFGLLYA